MDKIKCLPEEGPIAFRFHPKIRALLKDKKGGKKLLDVGCDGGYIGKELHEMGYDVHGCDVRESNRFNFIKFKKVDLNEGKLPYESESFDCVICIEVLEHLENPRQIIREMSRVLKKGGIALVSTPNITSLPQKLYFLLTGNFLHFYWPARQYGHITPQNMHQLKDIFAKCNLKILKIDYDRGWIPLLRITMPRGSLFGDLCVIKLIKEISKKR